MNVSFSLAEVEDPNLQTTVYHMEEQANGSLNAERLSNHPVKLTEEEILEAYRRAMTPAFGNARQAATRRRDPKYAAYDTFHQKR